MSIHLFARAGGSLLQDLRRLWPVVSDRRLAFIGMVALGLAACVAEALCVGLVALVIYSGAAVGSGGLSTGGSIGRIGALLPDAIRHSLLALTLTLAVAVLLRTVLVAGYGVLAASIKTLIYHRLRMKLYQRYMFAPYQLASAQSIGTIANLFQVEAPRTVELVDQLFRLPITICAIAVFMLALTWLSWRVALIAVLAGGVLTAFMQIGRIFLHRLGRRMVLLHEDLSSQMLAGIQALRTIRAFGAERREATRFAEASRQVARTIVDFARVDSLLRPSTMVVMLLMMGLVIAVSRASAASGVATIAVLALLYRLQPHVEGFQACVTSIHGLESSLTLVASHLNAPEWQSPAEKGRPLDRLPAAIKFVDVYYQHPHAKTPSLHGVSFSIPRGLVTALIGPSGAGKSTILNLLLGLTVPSAGRIECDDLTLSQIDLSSWLGRVAITGQDIDLLRGSILENLRLGQPDLDRDRAREALDLAGALAFVDALPEGLDTLVGDRGLRLSGGQRQRIALARAIATRPELLILDEATSAVEQGLEEDIHRCLRAALPGLTLLVVAHRSSALQEADQIVEIRDGAIFRNERVRGSSPLLLD